MKISEHTRLSDTTGAGAGRPVISTYKPGRGDTSCFALATNYPCVPYLERSVKWAIWLPSSPY